MLVTHCNSNSINLLHVIHQNTQDKFGYSVSISGDTIVVGAYEEDSNATGVNGDQGARDSGAAYVFVRNTTTWTQQAYLRASNTDAYDYFGWSVSISGDSIVVGAIYEDSNATGVNGDQNNLDATDSGAAYVFVREATTWTQQAYLKASNTGVRDYFGHSVSISGDTIVVGAYQENSNAKGVNGDQNDDSALYAGAAYVFVRIGATWTQQAYLKASNTESSDNFGWSVSISGDTIAVGAKEEDSNAVGVNGDQSNNDIPDSGAAYIFVREGITWTQQAYLKASNTGVADYFGYSVSISGDTIVVGAYGEDSNATGVNEDQSNDRAFDSGAAYVFVRNGTTWTQQAYLKASNTGGGDAFGYSLSISGHTIVVGAYHESSNAIEVNGDQNNDDAFDSGAAYVFVRNGTSWTQQAYLKADSIIPNGQFATTVAVGDYIVAGQVGMVTVFGELIADTPTTGGTTVTTSTTEVTSATVATSSTILTTGATDVIGGSTMTTGGATTTSTLIEATESTSFVGVATENSDDDGAVVIIAVVVSVVVFAIVSVIIGFLFFKQKRNNSQHSSAVSLPLQSKSILKNIKIEELLGSGNFGSNSINSLNNFELQDLCIVEIGKKLQSH
jgi:hypothetical protein